MLVDNRTKSSDVTPFTHLVSNEYVQACLCEKDYLQARAVAFATNVDAEIAAVGSSVEVGPAELVPDEAISAFQDRCTLEAILPGTRTTLEGRNLGLKGGHDSCLPFSKSSYRSVADGHACKR